MNVGRWGVSRPNWQMMPPWGGWELRAGSDTNYKGEIMYELYRELDSANRRVKQLLAEECRIYGIRRLEALDGDPIWMVRFDPKTSVNGN